jgi:hypothetical protein
MIDFTAKILSNLDYVPEWAKYGDDPPQPQARPIAVGDFMEIRPGVHRLGDAPIFGIYAGHVETCQQCGGSGVIRICPRCHATGTIEGRPLYHRREDEVCNACRGTGQVEAIVNLAPHPGDEDEAYCYGYAIDLAEMVKVLNCHGIDPEGVMWPIFVGLNFTEDQGHACSF